MRRLSILLLAVGSLGFGVPGAASAQGGGLVVSPEPGTPDASSRTQISLLGVSPQSIQSVTVTGSSSGAHTGHLAPYAAVQGASFLPDKRFTDGERVSASVQMTGAQAPVTWSFRIARRAPAIIAPTPAQPRTSKKGAQTFVSRPDLYPPQLALSGQMSPDGGDLFIAPKVGPLRTPTEPGQTSAMIFDPQGRVIWTTPSAPGRSFYDFRARTLGGAPVLTWWEGAVNAIGVGHGFGVILDDSYRVIAHVLAGNGYSADLHEFLVQPDGTAWMTAYAKIGANLKRVGGPSDGAMYDSIVQRVDIKTGLVLYEWHGLGHLSVTESYLKPVPGFPWDPFHLNSIQPLADGTMLLSGRNASALYLVDQASGHILWRLAGRRSDFAIARDAGFAWQHDARLQPDGTITMFDNEAAPQVGPRSRGLVLKVDTARKRVTVIRQYLHPGKVLSGSQGDVETLPNGNRVVGWGAGALVSEFTGAGHRVFDLRFPAPLETYRAYRLPWTGHPADNPAVAAKAGSGGTLNVYASWNGATQVARWQVLTGSSANALAPAASAAWNGLETTIPVKNAGPYVAVQALGADGTVLGTSPAITH